MKKVLIIIIPTIGLLTWVFFAFRNGNAVATSAAQQWPGQMGTLEKVGERWPRIEANSASVKLSSLGEALPKNDKAIDDYVAHEITRDEIAIAEPPQLADITTIRDLLLHESIHWERYDEIGDSHAIAARLLQMNMARTLVASALTKARASSPAAWDDLHAVWKLARSLDGHPQMMTRTAALAMARMVNAVAWKMPLPAPAWLDELQARDEVRPLLEAFQHQTASYWRSSARFFPTTWLATSIDHDRKIAEDLFKFTGCAVNTPMNQLGTDLTSLWRRAFRYRAEREATANALRVREGKTIETSSRCSDGSWTFDGNTLRFSHEIATAPPDSAMPLELHIKAGTGVFGAEKD
jgi:hypothetical protein